MLHSIMANKFIPSLRRVQTILLADSDIKSLPLLFLKQLNYVHIGVIFPN